MAFRKTVPHNTATLPFTGTLRVGSNKPGDESYSVPWYGGIDGAPVKYVRDLLSKFDHNGEIEYLRIVEEFIDNALDSFFKDIGFKDGPISISILEIKDCTLLTWSKEDYDRIVPGRLQQLGVKDCTSWGDLIKHLTSGKDPLSVTNLVFRQSEPDFDADASLIDDFITQSPNLRGISVKSEDCRIWDATLFENHGNLEHLHLNCVGPLIIPLELPDLARTCPRLTFISLKTSAIWIPFKNGNFSEGWSDGIKTLTTDLGLFPCLQDVLFYTPRSGEMKRSQCKFRHDYPQDMDTGEIVLRKIAEIILAGNPKTTIKRLRLVVTRNGKSLRTEREIIVNVGDLVTPLKK